MEKRQNDLGIQQSNERSNLEPTENTTDLSQLNLNVEETEEDQKETIVQRRPQFRYSENYLRRSFN